MKRKGRGDYFRFTGGFDLENGPQNSVQKRGFVLLLIKVKLLLNVSGLIRVYISLFSPPLLSTWLVLSLQLPSQLLCTVGNSLLPLDANYVGSSSDNMS